MGGLTAFFALYLSLAAWLVLIAWRLTLGANAGAQGVVWGYVAGGGVAFLALVLIRAMFFVRRGGNADNLEITAREQPRLFEFLHQLADAAGAPRPHRVFVSPRVNACLFYDLSVFNLFLPPRKNLEIGLGLVNVLTLGELRAVLAHEFGHFSRRTTAVGRWVYVALQVAAQLVARRDAPHRPARFLSGLDARLAWIGWLPRLLAWSIRSLVESAFSGVLMMQRALWREMELQADSVAVSLTGSNALIHALYRLQAADDAWERTLEFINGESSKRRATRDVFAIQRRIIGHLGPLLGTDDYGAAPPVPGEHPELHRVFAADPVQPPRMWSAHPLNHEREENAKRVYVETPIDARSAWELLEHRAGLREQVSASLLGVHDAGVAANTDSLNTLDRQWRRESYKPAYRGAYLDRSVVRHVAAREQLYAPRGAAAVGSSTLTELDALYPDSLAQDVERLRRLEREWSQLESLRERAPGGTIRYRGRPLMETALPRASREVERELAAQRAKLHEHDRRCRSAHRAAAAILGADWEAWLLGLGGVLHYAEHTEANLRDAHTALAGVLALESGAGRVSSKGTERVLVAAREVHGLLTQLYEHAGSLTLDASLLARLEAPGWRELLGELRLNAPDRNGLAEWLDAIDDWFDHATGLLAALGSAALEQLLEAEAVVARHLREGGDPGKAPGCSHLPEAYPTLHARSKRKQSSGPGWWTRFQDAEGTPAALARLWVAGTMVGGVLVLGFSVGAASVTVYNGLARPIRVSFGPQQLQLRAFSYARLEVAAGQRYRVEARSLQGNAIESFEATTDRGFVHHVYNVAGASPLVEWSAAYGKAQASPPRGLGAARWTRTAAQVVFGEPPRQVASQPGGSTRWVLSGYGEGMPGRLLAMLGDEAERRKLVVAHARWDSATSRYAMLWLSAAAELPEIASILALRLKEDPRDMLALRLEFDTAPEAARSAVCARQRALFGTTAGNRYLAIRCIRDKEARDAAYLKASAAAPQDGWLAFAAGQVHGEQARWQKALASLDIARRQIPALASSVVVDIIRLRRLLDDDVSRAIAEAKGSSELLDFLLGLENGEIPGDPPLKAYAELARGRLAQALQIARARPETEARVLRLAAASDGATEEMVSRALALDIARGIDRDTMWTSLALAARAQHDLAPYIRILGRHAGDARTPRMLEFLQILRRNGDPETAQKLLDGFSPELRAQAYSLGLVMLGEKAPAQWRVAAKRLLFASERPYFN